MALAKVALHLTKLPYEEGKREWSAQV